MNYKNSGELNMRHFMLLPALLLLFFWGIPSVHACQIMSQPETINITELTDNAMIILVGEVSNITYGDEWEVIIEVEVEQYLKGEGLAFVQIHLFCATHAEIDKRHIFFLNPSSSQAYVVAYVSNPYAYEPTIPATDDNIAAVQAITGQSTAPQPLPFSSQFIRFTNNNKLFLVGSTLSLLALAGVFWFIRRKAGGKPKMKREEIP